MRSHRRQLASAQNRTAGGAAVNPSTQPPKTNHAWVAQQLAIYHASSLLPFRVRTASPLVAEIAAGRVPRRAATRPASFSMSSPSANAVIAGRSSLCLIDQHREPGKCCVLLIEFADREAMTDDRPQTVDKLRPKWRAEVVQPQFKVFLLLQRDIWVSRFRKHFLH